MNIKKPMGGFTLLETLVVVLIIAVLAAVAVPQYQKAVEKSRITEAVSYMNIIENDITLYILEHGVAGDTLYTHMNPSLKVEEDDAVYSTTGNWRLGAGCSSDPNECSIVADRKIGDNFTFSLLSKLNFEESSAWQHRCYTQKLEEGRTMCHLLEKEGWEYKDKEI